MPRDYISKDLRKLVTERAQGYCRSPGRFALDSMEIECVIPSRLLHDYLDGKNRNSIAFDYQLV